MEEPPGLSPHRKPARWSAAPQFATSPIFHGGQAGSQEGLRVTNRGRLHKEREAHREISEAWLCTAAAGVRPGKARVCCCGAGQQSGNEDQR